MNKWEPCDWDLSRWEVLQNFTSKKNTVQLVQSTHRPDLPPLVLKTFADPGVAELEGAMLKILKDWVRVPELVGQNHSILLLEYLPGLTLTDWLEQSEMENPAGVPDSAREKMAGLLDWLTGFYARLEQWYGESWIMGDVNLRNFIVGDALAGLDFENVRQGRKSEDLGAIAAFILKYDPADTLWKQQLVDYWLTEAARVFALDHTELKAAMAKELQAMQIRRAERNG